jgi:hypothetical protein
MAPARFPPFHFDSKENLVLISLNRYGMVVVGLGASLKGEIKFGVKKEYFYTFKL